MNIPLKPFIDSASQTRDWSQEVLAFAEAKKLSDFLAPLLQASRRIFPTARQIDVYVKDDPEIANDRHIVFDIRIPFRSFVETRVARKEWNTELLRVCSPTPACHFQLLLDLESS